MSSIDTHIVLPDDIDPHLTSHIVLEKLKYQPLDEVVESVIMSQRDRVSKWMKDSTSAKANEDNKVKNPIATLPGVPGCGKSTLLAHLPFSPQYREYWQWRRKNTLFQPSDQRPLACLITFNDGMGNFEAGEVACGLRIIYGALKSTNATNSNWEDFYCKYSSLKDLSPTDAIKMIREVFGKTRLIFVGVDELKKIDDMYSGDIKVSKLIVEDLGQLLNGDIYTDVLVSTPAYMATIVSSNRSFRYLPVTPLNMDKWGDEFHDSTQKLIDQIINAREKAGCTEQLDPFVLRILKSMYLLTSGHARSAERLKEDIDNGNVFKALEELLVDKRVRCTPFMLIKALINLYGFQMFNAPATKEEQEIILSISPLDLSTKAVPRAMVEGINSDHPRCFIFESYFITFPKFRISTTLAMFFRMLDDINKSSESDLGPLGRAAKNLFNNLSDENFRWSDLLKRAYGMMIVSRVSHSIYIRLIFGVSCLKFFNGEILETKDLSVVIANSSSDMKWSPNTLIVAPPGYSGWDHMTCLVGAGNKEITVYSEVKVYNPKSNFTKEFAEKLLVTMSQFIKDNPNLTNASVEEKIDALENVYFVLSIYGYEIDKFVLYSIDQIKDELLNYLKEPKWSAEVELVHKYLDSLWYFNIAFQGTEDITDSMVPVLLPIAQLVQATE
jgi:hypothetical protein